jgi:hypothetical protein
VGCPVGSDFAVFTADTATVTQVNWAFYVAVIA